MKKTIYIFPFILVWLMITTVVSAQSQQQFTLDELAKFNGKNGAKAYVAVNGVVYDVTNVPGWPQGKHLCPGALAGKDISNLWNKVPPSHRGPDFLKKFKAVGTLSTKPKDAPSPSPQAPAGQKKSNNATAKPDHYLWVALIVLGAAVGVWLFLRFRKK